MTRLCECGVAFQPKVRPRAGASTSKCCSEACARNRRRRLAHELYLKCRTQRLAYTRKWNRENRQRMLATQRAYREANLAKVRESTKRWHANNRDRVRAYRQSEPRKTAYRAWARDYQRMKRAQDMPAYRARLAAWKEAHPERVAEYRRRHAPKDRDRVWLCHVRARFGRTPPEWLMEMLLVARAFRRSRGWARKKTQVAA